MPRKLQTSSKCWLRYGLLSSTMIVLGRITGRAAVASVNRGPASRSLTKGSAEALAAVSGSQPGRVGMGA
ncbi:hypothetical protein ACFYT4_26835 [Streptomyces sp. NPDC004609]|uniref:hypothetical protein n=1 Tax=Streptomyces sp. NPDC004609 TaxID=3364704 RepID=UPI0036C977EA